jgi:hypothetical protein
MNERKKPAHIRGFAGRADVLKVMPEELVLITDKGHALFDPSALAPPDDRIVRSIIAKGYLQACQVIRDGDRLVVVDGRTRCIAGREANRQLKAAGKPPIPMPVTIRRDSEAEAADVMVATRAPSGT